MKALLLAACFFPAAQAGAMTPPTAAEAAAYRLDGSLPARSAFARAVGNNRPAAGAVAMFRRQARGLRAAPPPAWRGMPTAGTPKVFALLIEFSDYPHNVANSTASVQAKIFGAGAGGYPYESLNRYYQRSSYGALDIGGATLGWYSTSTARTAISTTTAGREALISEALDHYNAAGHDFTQYDNDGDGTIDYFAVLWTGPDDGWGNFWWAYQTAYTSATYTVDGKKLGLYSWQWESRPHNGAFWPATLIHETGHALGLPDYYDYDGTVGPDGGVGGLDMMDSGLGDHNAFSKFMLGWLAPVNLGAGSAQGALRPADAYAEAVKVFPGSAAGNIFEEYFLVQNRRQTGNDQDLPGTGLLIWHVDATLDGTGNDFLYDNSYTARKLLRLMEADGLEEIEAGTMADAEDYYVPLKKFGPSTSPSSARYGGAASGVYLDGIGGLEASRTFSYGVNDTRAGYTTVTDNLFRPGGGGRARLDATLQQAGDLAVKVYTVNGRLVKTLYSGPAAAGTLSFFWDGATDAGGRAAAGLYLITTRGPGISSVQKVVLLR